MVDIIYAFKALKIIGQQEKMWLILSVLTNLVLGLIPITTVWVLQKVINSVVVLIQTSSNDIMSPLLWLVIQFLLTMVHSTIQSFQMYIDRKTEDRLEVFLQEQVLNKAVSVSVFYFDIPDFYNKIDRISGGVGGKFLSPVRGMLIIFKEATVVTSISFYLYSIHWSLIALSLLAAIPILFIQRKVGLKHYLLIFRNTALSREVQ